jgi:hypothetical protein
MSLLFEPCTNNPARNRRLGAYSDLTAIGSLPSDHLGLQKGRSEMMRGDRYSNLFWRGISVALASMWLMFASTATAQVFSLEEPPFNILVKSADYELRSYRPMVVAEVFVQGDVTSAGKEGSRLVKDYIFRQGVNEPVGAGQKVDEKISMTVPVTMEKAPEKISMTVPVTMESNAGSGYRLHFVMPSKYTLQTLPKPADPRVTLREIPAQRVAAVRFSKFSTEATIAAQTALLQSWMAQQGLKAAGKPQFARYDPPFVPPLLRRSEILIAVE